MIGLNDPVEPGPAPSRAIPLTTAMFREGGWLQEEMHLEHRPEQAHMAGTVAAALGDDDSLVFEAGTGVGKSLAYLVPGLIRAVDTGRPFIVSTHTIALQEQIEQKDLPLCRRIFSSRPETAAYADFKSAVLVGKTNYLCTTRLSHALAEKSSLFSDAEFAELQRIADWADRTETGLRHELQPPPLSEVWEAVCADSSGCSRRHCDPERCFYQRARSRVRGSNLIIVNHALLFALISAGGARSEGSAANGRGVLFPDDFLVLDEAHTVPAVATDHFGVSVSSYGVERALKSLHNPRTKRGLLRKRGGLEGAALVESALAATVVFFAEVEKALLTPRSVARLREDIPVAPTYETPLQALQQFLLRAADRLEDGRERDELMDQAARIKAIGASATEWLQRADPGQVYWAERGGKRQTIVTLRGAPIDVAPELRQHLFGRGVSVVATSATLALAGDMEPFVRRCGAEGSRVGLVLSPFDYERCMRVYVAGDVPLPGSASGDEGGRLAIDAVIDYVKFCTLQVKGGSLVLFTSYSDLRAVAAAIGPAIAAAGRPLLIQGEALSRTELTRQMRAAGNAVLLGTESFWTGIDVPGSALSQVIVTRLPFDPPDHPITEAQAERIRDAGGSPFNELMLPQALIQFRQGVGRLIRSHTDRGVVTLLDGRILAKAYGRLFIDSLPRKEFVRLTRGDRGEKFIPFP
ncbi:MAG TPA: helicase C-terminal domain-containing protein [Opitutaceae bacterium]|jgi:ATP-dependent DNA helicase DinG